MPKNRLSVLKITKMNMSSCNIEDTKFFQNVSLYGHLVLPIFEDNDEIFFQEMWYNLHEY